MLYMAHSYDHDVAAQVSADVIPELTKLYKLEEGQISMNQVISALHKIGIKKVVTDDHARYLAAKQAAEIIEKKIGKAPVIITDSSAVMNFVDRYFPKMKDKIEKYDSVQEVFAKMAGELAGEKPLKTVNITNVKEAGAEGKETGNADYVINARELYRIFLRTGGAPARKNPAPADKIWTDGVLPHENFLGKKEWNLESDPEEMAILVGGKAYRCAVAHNLGQVRKLLEGEYKNFDAIRLMA